jgi:hypothetical protein
MENNSDFFNLTNNIKKPNTSYLDDYESVEYHIWTIFPPILLVLGTVGNSLTIIIYLRTPLRKTALSVYAITLAVSDTIALYIGLLQTWLLYVFEEGVRTSSLLCKFNSWMIFTSLQVSTWIISAVTIERVAVVWFPFRYRKKVEGRKHAVIIVILICVFIILLNSHFLYGITYRYTYQEVRFERSCTGVTKEYSYFVQNIWPFIDAVVYYIVPSTIIVIGNVLIVHKVTKSRKLSQGRHVGSTVVNESSGGNQNRRSLLAIVLTLNMAFLLTTSPICLFQLANNFNDLVIKNEEHMKGDETTALWTILFMIMNINHSTNCFIYVITGSTFRRELTSVLCGRFRSV